MEKILNVILIIDRKRLAILVPLIELANQTWEAIKELFKNKNRRFRYRTLISLTFGSLSQN